MVSDETRVQGPGPDDRTGRRRVELNGVQLVASVAAAVSAAAAASALGVAGTVIGTAVVSVVATVGNALYTASLRRTTVRLKDAQVRVRRRTGRIALGAEDARTVSEQIGAGPADDELTTGTEPTGTATTGAEPVGATAGYGPVGAGPVGAGPVGAGPVGARSATRDPAGPERRTWRTGPRIGVLVGSTAVVFALAFGLLTGIEAVMGHSFASLWGHGSAGSTAGAVFDGRVAQPQHDPGPGPAAPTGGPSSVPPGGAPSPGPSSPRVSPSPSRTTSGPTTPPPTPSGSRTPTPGPSAPTSAPPSDTTSPSAGPGLPGDLPQHGG